MPYPRSLIITFAVRCLDSIIPILVKSKISVLSGRKAIRQGFFMTRLNNNNNNKLVSHYATVVCTSMRYSTNRKER